MPQSYQPPGYDPSGYDPSGYDPGDITTEELPIPVAEYAIGPSELSVPVGLDGAADIVICDAAGSPIDYGGAEPLSAVAWRGDDTIAVLGAVAASWMGPAVAGGRKFRLAVVGSATATLTPGDLRIRVAVTQGGRTYAAYEAWLHLTDAPGSTAEPTCWCSLQDMLDVGGDWLSRMRPIEGRADFVESRARATAELRSVILARWRPCDRGIDLGSYDGRWTSPDAPDPYLAGLLDAGGLVVDAGVRNAVACLAVSYACERAVTWEDGDLMPARAAHYARRWRAAIPGLSVGIDTDADGDADFWIPMGVIP